MSLPRGIANHNPGNIRRGTSAWQGMSLAQPDPDFISFDTPEYGLRALMKILLTYQDKDDIEHVQGMILRWAPPSENDTGAYVRDVCLHVGVKPDDYISLHVPENLIRMAQAITHHENGNSPDPTLPWWYPDETYETAAAMALGHQPEPIV